MVEIAIDDMIVEFPFQPYDCQIQIMTSIIRALDSRQNAVIESPTGTGKTLSILCSVLAWRQKYKKFLESEGLIGANVPKVIYTSRTHSQLSQVIKELKRTIYNPQCTLIGSRENLCIHPDLKNVKSNWSRIHMCRAKIKNRTCHYYLNTIRPNRQNGANSHDPSLVTTKTLESDGVTDKKMQNTPALLSCRQRIFDIEDLIHEASKHIFCPYYASRDLQEAAEVIVMPYNYLIDSKNRRINHLKLENAIVIVDESHNLPQTCEDAYSQEITSNDLGMCIREIDQISKLVSHRALEPDEVSRSSQNDASTQTSKLQVITPSSGDLIRLKKIILGFENELMLLLTNNSKNGEIESKPSILRRMLVSHMEATGEQALKLLIEALQTCCIYLANESQWNSVNVSFSIQTFSNFIECLMEATKDSDDNYYDDGNKDECESDNNSTLFKVFMTTKEIMSTPDNVSSDAPKASFSVKLWCFSASFALKDLLKQNIYNIILASGTLAPLKSFLAELSISFPIVLENNHVVSRNQLMIKVLSHGPITENGETTDFDSSYSNRTNSAYLKAIGGSIITISRHIPGGIIVFFQSHPAMNATVECWKKSGIWERMSNLRIIYLETRVKEEFNQIISTLNRNSSRIESSLCDKNSKKMIFFAVCRGRASEGLDLPSDQVRAVFLIGIPYAPRNDPRIRLKFSVIDELNQKVKNVNDKISSEFWYQQQAMRAVNQAIGRIIRDHQDFGAVYLMDKRFNAFRIRDQFPKWLRNWVESANDFGSLISDTREFFQSFTNDPKKFDRANGVPLEKFNSKKSSFQNFKDHEVTPILSLTEDIALSTYSKYVNNLSASSTRTVHSPGIRLLADSLISDLEMARTKIPKCEPCFKSYASIGNNSKKSQSKTIEQTPNVSGELKMQSKLTDSLKKQNDSSLLSHEQNTRENQKLYVKRLKEKLSLDEFKKAQSLYKMYQSNKDGKQFIGEIRNILPFDLLLGLGVLLESETDRIYFASCVSN